MGIVVSPGPSLKAAIKHYLSGLLLEDMGKQVTMQTLAGDPRGDLRVCSDRMENSTSYPRRTGQSGKVTSAGSIR